MIDLTLNFMIYIRNTETTNFNANIKYVSSEDEKCKALSFL